jgi:acetyl-CoA synthase
MGIFHMGQRDMNWLRISKEAKAAGFKIRHFADILRLKILEEYGAIVDKVQLTIFTKQEEIEKLLPEAQRIFSERDARIGSMTDESVDTFYSCTICQSYAPAHVCIISPERLGLCGAYNWLDGKAAFEINPHGGNQPALKVRAIDTVKGQWEGIDEVVKQKSGGHLSTFNLYSIMQNPMTSCGCFECIVALLPEANGVMIVTREYAGDTPCGMKFTTLAGSVGGGAQTPGFLGVGRLYITSKKFISADGGLRRLVWIPKELKEAIKDRLVKRCQEIGEPSLFDKIADETVATSIDELLPYLQRVKHPALEMEPLI